MPAHEPGLDEPQRLELQSLAQRIPLHAGRGGIFILTASSDRTLRAVEDELQRLVDPIKLVALPNDPDDPLMVLRGLVEEVTFDPAQVLFTLDLSKRETKDFIRTLVALNLRREYVPDFKVMLLVWLRPNQYERFQDMAKDFWSFRSAVARFDDAEPEP